jgi:hypothetical protein
MFRDRMRVLGSTIWICLSDLLMLSGLAARGADLQTMGLLDSSQWHARWITYPELLNWVRPHLELYSNDVKTLA